MTRRVLVTGDAGFIGSNLARKCIDEGWHVIGVDDMSNGKKEFIPADIDKHYYTCFSAPEILNLIKRQQIDTVFHIAAIPRVSYSIEYPLHTNDVNVSRTLKLMDACRGNIERFVFASSSSVYGGADVLPTPESYPKKPKSPYALQKSMIEDYLTIYNNIFDLESVSLRFHNVFGKNQVGSSPYATAISAWLTAILCKRPLRFDGDGTQTRDVCHVDNVVNACVRAAKYNGKLSAQALNVACGESVSNNEVLSYFLKRYPWLQVKNAPWRLGDVMHTKADITKIKEILGYEPLVKVWDGIDKTIAWAESSPEFLTL